MRCGELVITMTEGPVPFLKASLALAEVEVVVFVVIVFVVFVVS